MRRSTLVLLAAFAILVLSAFVGNHLESSGILTRERLGPQGIAAVVAFYFGLFCLIGFALVPVLLHVFLAGQIKIGHADLGIIRWLQANEQRVVYGVWALFATGLYIAYVLAWDGILAQIK